jgi:NADP-dependent 3-hydroxy acid dehydrogenase YdfG
MSKNIVWVAGVNASAGLGAAVARRFARAGYIAVVSGRTQPRLEAIASEIKSAGGEAHALVLDVSDEAAVVAAATRVASMGALEVGVFNAGVMVAKPSLELRARDFEDALKVNTIAGFVFGREVIRALLPQQRGSVLFTGATAAMRGRPPFSAFAASKAALRSVSQSLAREFGPRGVHVAHFVIDGAIDGERVRTHAPDLSAQRGPDGMLSPDAIAEVYFQVHAQPRSAWTQELDLRPYKESF